MLWRAPWMQERFALLVLALWDLIALTISYNLVYWYRFSHFPGLTLGLSVLLLVWISSSYLLGRYSARPISSWVHSKLLRLCIVVAIVLLVFVSHSWLFVVTDSGTRFRGFLLPVLGIGFSLSILAQMMVRRVRPNVFAWLLVLTDHESIVIERELSAVCLQAGSRPRLCSPSEFEALVWERSLDGEEWSDITVSISSQVKLKDEVVERLLGLRGHGTQVYSLIDWCEIVLQRVPPELIDQRWFITADGFSIQPGRMGWRLKRLFDVSGALLLIGLTAPLMLLVMVLIRLDDGGPIFYSQIRTGLYGELLKIWKFRSMRQDAESDGIQWASPNDPRVTRLGLWLRRLRIDELPQLFAVLAGELSLIGPRPERPELEQILELDIPHYRIRHWIRPGLSGWAQVNYPYGASLDDSRIKLSFDIFYVRNAGILLDLLIVFRTIRMILKAEGAQPLRSARQK